MDYKKIFRNYYSIKETEFGVLPVRYTDNQLDLFSRLSENLRIRSLSTSSVTMEFLACGKIEFEYSISLFSRPNPTFDIFENDCFVITIEAENNNSCKFEYHTVSNLPTKITITLPYGSNTQISNFKADSFEYLDNPKKLNMLCIGDSITQGIETESSSTNYPSLLAKYLDANLINQGIGGYWYDPESLDKLEGFEPDIITVAYGANDTLFEDLTEVDKRINQFYIRLKELYKNAKIFIISPIYRTDLYKDSKVYDSVTKVISYINQRAKEHDLPVIDGYKLVPHMEQYYLDKVLHPNAKGFLHYTLNLIKEMNI